MSTPALALRRLMRRRSLHSNRRGKDGQLHRETAYFLVHAPAGTPLPEIISREGGRWQIEEDNEIDKQLVGLGSYRGMPAPPNRRRTHGAWDEGRYPARRKCLPLDRQNPSTRFIVPAQNNAGELAR
ncbi:hypothetical protein [Streptomyces sp. NPDC005096]|uniref:hypothetical protein n=1 Tax=Streptomyces sp. NPDC005096 TaxID=3154559 RepID=UPI0033B6A989